MLNNVTKKVFGGPECVSVTLEGTLKGKRLNFLVVALKTAASTSFYSVVFFASNPEIGEMFVCHRDSLWGSVITPEVLFKYAAHLISEKEDLFLSNFSTQLDAFCKVIHSESIDSKGNNVDILRLEIPFSAIAPEGIRTLISWEVKDFDCACIDWEKHRISLCHHEQLDDYDPEGCSGDTEH